MPDIPLLQPVVLRGVVEKFTAPQSLIMLNRVPRAPWPFPSAAWDVVRGSRAVAKPNVPNSEAHIVPRLGRSQESAAFVYLREKKVFEPTTLHWLRAPGQLAAANAEQAVMREIGDLNQRFDNFAELMIFNALSGTLTLDYPDVQASVDYKFISSHLPTASTLWGTATPKQIVSDITTWKRSIARDGRVPARSAFCSEVTVRSIFDSFATTGASNFYGGTLLSDRMKDQYYSTGVLPGFMGLEWTVCENVYNSAGDGTSTSDYGSSPTNLSANSLFLPDGKLIIGNFDDNRPIELFEGPTADDEAPENFTGKFAKTWKDKDPSARQYLLEWNVLPVITRPEQFAFCTVL